MKPYSHDLRERLIHALEADEAPPRKGAARWCVRRSFVEKLWHRWRDSGSGAAPPHAGGKPRALTDHTALRRSAVAPHPDATLEAWRERGAAQGPQVRPATICRA
jgi:putative transposase